MALELLEHQVHQEQLRQQQDHRPQLLEQHLAELLEQYQFHLRQIIMEIKQ
jgi:hypothetical protein